MNELPLNIEQDVKLALAEDVGDGDITAMLVPATNRYKVRVITREDAILCGREWVAETFRQVDADVVLDWHVEDGEKVSPEQTLFTAEGSARSILTAERTALNFLQLLSGTATKSYHISQILKDFDTRILDTRKTLPGLRLAQKYAVRCGGCFNHRLGLYDAFLIKENHIAACGSIESAIESARSIDASKPVEIEVESLTEFRAALAAGADIIMLDELSLDDMRSAVLEADKRCKLEASGNMTSERLVDVASTGVDFISMGSLTKHVTAIDLSMRFV